MFNNAYLSPYNPQITLDRINNQITELEKIKQQISQQNLPQPSINQTFQLAPTGRDVIKYAGSIDEVQKEPVIGDTPYFSKDMSVVWVKNVNGNIKIYELTEVIPKDEKDMRIALLQEQIEELKKGIKNNEQYVANVNDTIKNEEPSKISAISKFKTKSK